MQTWFIRHKLALSLADLQTHSWDSRSGGGVWLALVLDSDVRREPLQEYTHIAFTVRTDNLRGLIERLTDAGVRCWQRSHPAITSGRKLRDYSGWEILGILLRLAAGGWSSFWSRKGLEIWYERRQDPGSRNLRTR